MLFFSHEFVNLEEARCILVESVEKFRSQLNANINLSNNIELEAAQTNLGFNIGFIKSNGELIDEPYIASVILCKEIVYYGIYNFNTDTLNNFFSEPYQKAKEIVDQQKF